jgi:hypothetical protein
MEHTKRPIQYTVPSGRLKDRLPAGEISGVRHFAAAGPVPRSITPEKIDILKK